MQYVHSLYYCIFFPLCAHILYFDSPKFSIKLFSLIYFTVSFVRQRDEYEQVIETRPIKTSLHTVGTESIQTPLNFSLFFILQPFAKIICSFFFLINVHTAPHIDRKTQNC